MPPPALALDFVAEIAVGPTCRVELCRTGGEGGAPRLCAVKRLHPEIAGRAEAEALLADVWQVAALHHPNVVDVLGLGMDERGAWVACELVEGISLARLMKTIGTTGESFHERMVVYLTWCIARGLVGANRLRSADGGPLEVVHRDLVAESILVGFGGDVKISDLGWAGTRRRAAGGSRIAPLRRGTTLLPPEEVQGDEVAQRADVFALGALAFELIAGRPPWAAQSRGDLLARVTDEDAPPLERLRPGADPELCALIARCLARDPAGRFQHASALLVQLEAWLAQKGYEEDNRGALARFVRRNAMKQMRWFERVLTGTPAPERVPPSAPPPRPEPEAEPEPHGRHDIEAAVTTDERLPLRAARFEVDAPDAAAIAAAAGAGDDDELEAEVPTRLAIRSPVRAGHDIPTLRGGHDVPPRGGHDVPLRGGHDVAPVSDDTVVDAEHGLPAPRPSSTVPPPPSESPSDAPTVHRVAPMTEAMAAYLRGDGEGALAAPRVPSATSVDVVPGAFGDTPPAPEAAAEGLGSAPVGLAPLGSAAMGIAAPGAASQPAPSASLHAGVGARSHPPGPTGSLVASGASAQHPPGPSASLHAAVAGSPHAPATGTPQHAALAPHPSVTQPAEHAVPSSPPHMPAPRGVAPATPAPPAASSRPPPTAHPRTPAPPAARPSAMPAPRASGAPVRAQRIDPSELDDARLTREADRLHRAATARAEHAQVAAADARAAADRAQVAAGKARRAHEAAQLAREAARIAGKFGMAEAARKLERALEIEQAVEIGEERGDEARGGGDTARKR